MAGERPEAGKEQSSLPSPEENKMVAQRIISKWQEWIDINKGAKSTVEWEEGRLHAEGKLSICIFSI